MRKFQAIALAMLVASISLSGTSASAATTDTKSWEKVYFAPDSTMLTKAAKTELRQIAREYAGASTIVVTGYVQKGGSPWNNYTLAKKRAKAVTKYLKARGMTAKLTTKSGGVPKTGGATTKARRATLAITMPATVVPSPSESESASPIVYAIGDTGPAGGTIFILPSSQGGLGGEFYYEAAPATWYGGLGDPAKEWCDLHSTFLEATATAIGEGVENTLAMDEACESGAGNTAADYEAIVGSTTYSDWFLPSKDELNQLCRYARGQVENAERCDGAGDLATSFVADDYWSSSEVNDDNAWAQAFTDGEHYDSSDESSKSMANYVRPVRAFN